MDKKKCSFVTFMHYYYSNLLNTRITQFINITLSMIFKRRSGRHGQSCFSKTLHVLKYVTISVQASINAKQRITKSRLTTTKPDISLKSLEHRDMAGEMILNQVFHYLLTSWFVHDKTLFLNPSCPREL